MDKRAVLRERARRWRASHPGYAAGVQERYRLRHPEKAQESAQKYDAKNRDSKNGYGREWRSRNKARVKRLNQEYLSANKELVKAKRREHYEKNRSAICLRQQAVYAERRDEILARNRAWAQANRPAVYMIKRRRRLKKMGIKGLHTFEQWMAKVAYYGWRCYYCGKQLSEDTLTQDHAVPVSKGGTNFVANLLPACKSCNSSKGAKKPSEFKRAA